MIKDKKINFHFLNKLKNKLINVYLLFVNNYQMHEIS